VQSDARVAGAFGFLIFTPGFERPRPVKRIEPFGDDTFVMSANDAKRTSANKQWGAVEEVSSCSGTVANTSLVRIG
jgi:hypothetical protein